MSELWIVAAKRTPIGRLLGALSSKSAADLGVAAALGAFASSGVEPGDIDLVIVGNVISAGAGQNIARQIAVRAGVPVSAPAFAVNMMCASGMQAVFSAAQAIQSGQASVVLCGGAESMSQAPYLLERARGGYKLGDGSLVDSILRDGLVDAFDREHMAISADRLAVKYGIDRGTQDRFALRSQQLAGQAMQDNALAPELAPLKELVHDEHPRPETTLDKLASLKAAFPAPPGGATPTITAGNASGINDGAAMLILCSDTVAKARGWKKLATLRAFATAGCDPREMGLGPVHATRRLCKSMEVGVDSFDTVELNEAFAAQALACVKELELDPGRVNPEGGAIAYGHPIGATGARLLTHLAHRIAQGRSRSALATLCVGGGMGAAAALTP